MARQTRPSWGERIVLCGLIAFLALCSFGAIYGASEFFMSLGKHLAAWVETRNWQQVPMRIESVSLDSTIRSHSRRRSYHYRVKASYSYQIGINVHRGDRSWLLTDYTHMQGVHIQLLNRLKEHQKSGLPFPGYVDPQNPTRSLLDRSFRGVWWIGTFGIALMFGELGLAIPLLGLKVFREERISNRLESQHPHEPWLWEPQTAEGRIPPKRNWILPTMILVSFATAGLPMVIDIWWVGEPIEFGLGLLIVGFPIATFAAAIDVALHAWHWRRFGTQSLQVVNWPLRLGKSARFRIEWKKAPAPLGPLYVTLSIVSRRDESTLSIASQSFVAGFQLDMIVEKDAHGVFQWDCPLPANQFPSEKSPSDTRKATAFWTLTISESQNWLRSRFGFQAEYTLPVFR